MTKDDLLVLANSTILYLPIQLNNYVHNIDKQAIRVFECESKIFGAVKEYIAEKNDKIIIIDFLGIVEIKRVFDSLLKSNIVVVNIDENAFNKLKDEQFISDYFFDENKKIIYHKNLFISNEIDKEAIEKFCCTSFTDLMTTNGAVCDRINEFIVKCVEEPEANKLVKLRSSNIYANKYVQIKNLFYEPVELKVIIYYMVHLIYEFVKENQIKPPIYFVSSSATGAAISNIIRQVFSKEMKFLTSNFSESFEGLETIHLIHLGPNQKDRNLEINAKNYTYGNFIFIFDFMCLGTEFKLIKEFISNNNAQLVGAFGIAHFKLPHFDSKKEVFTLVDVANWKGNREYKISAQED